MSYAMPCAAPWQLLPACVALLAACAGHPPHDAPAPGAAVNRPAPASVAPADGGDASYDWRVLVPVPFGTKFKDISMPLHEVLVFHDDSAGTADDAECYGSDAPAPQFVGRNPDERLLCFRRDRLARIRAAVTLDPAQSAATARVLCDRWMKNARPPQAAHAAPAPGADAVCDGIDGGVHFNARLAQDAEGVLVVTLDALSDP